MSAWTVELISGALSGRRLGSVVRYFPQVGSTNDVARQLASEGAPEGLLVVADEQTAGRGRLDRSWWAPPGTSLLMSFLLRPAIPLRLAGQLGMCVGLGAVEGIEETTGLRPRLKWPNDLLLAGRKLGGMITELRGDHDRVTYAVVGLGINVNVDFSHPDIHVTPVPDPLRDTATSLSVALGGPVDRLNLLAATVGRIDAWYARMMAGESPHRAWAERLDTLGRRILVTWPSGRLEGRAIGITFEGGLVLHDDDGRDHTVWSGDVTSVRNA